MAKTALRKETRDGAVGNVYAAKATVRDKKTGETKTVWQGEFWQPVDLENAIQAYGDEKVYKVWATEDYTNFLDAQRRAAVSSNVPPIFMAKIRKAWADKDTVKLEALCDALDLSMEDIGVMIKA